MYSSLVEKRNLRYLKRNQKLGIDLPRNVGEARILDENNGNTLWADAIVTEISNMKVTFQILDDGTRTPRDYQFVKCHMIYDVKMKGFRRKARLVAGGHMTTAPSAVTYASVVSRESVQIALTLAALNDLEVNCGDVLNAYITAPVKKEV